MAFIKDENTLKGLYKDLNSTDEKVKESATDILSHLSEIPLDELNQKLADYATLKNPPQPAKEPPVTPGSIITSLIKDEFEAIEGYNKALNFFLAAAEGFDPGKIITAKLTEIKGEEETHIKELKELYEQLQQQQDIPTPPVLPNSGEEGNGEVPPSGDGETNL